jgi:DNA primase
LKYQKRWATQDGANYDFFRNRIMFPIHNEKEISWVLEAGEEMLKKKQTRKVHEL